MSNAAPPGWYRNPNDPTTEHWWDGTAYRQSRPVAPPAPPMAAPYPVAVPVVVGFVGQVSPKSRLVATLLSAFLGGLGIDRFYLGNIGMGVAGSAHDGQGLPVRDWQA